jgi:hypothetical protein
MIVIRRSDKGIGLDRPFPQMPIEFSEDNPAQNDPLARFAEVEAKKQGGEDTAHGDVGGKDTPQHIIDLMTNHAKKWGVKF